MNQVVATAAEANFRKHLKRAEIYLSNGQPDAAIDSLEAALRINPEHIETRLRLAGIHLKAKRHNEGREQILKALSGHVESPRIALRLINHLDVIGESGTIIEIARQLVPSMWDSALSLSEVSRTLSQIGSHNLADQFASAAVAFDPNHPAAIFQQAKMDVFFGRLDDARLNVERCLAKVPEDPAAHWLRSQLRLPGGEARVDPLERLLAKATDPTGISHLGYALHNELHGLKDFNRAWQALESGCAAKRSLVNYRRENTVDLFAALQQFSSKEISSPDGCMDHPLRPIFVVGLHRSGTTLTERIISGHSQVAAGGETYDITSALRRASGIHMRSEIETQAVHARAGFDYRRIGEEYLRGMAWRAGEKRIVTDKLPSNFLNLGFIARALPQARIVRLRRDPIDVGLSNLRTLFGQACPYSYDQLDFADYSQHFERLMTHWHEVMPGRILDVNYSDLVDAPEQTARAIAEFCGLPFEPAMVKIEERSDAVSTASSVMMREGIRKDRNKVWSAYEKQLQPMIQQLQGGG